jgi:hypothetical protein
MGFGMNWNDQFQHVLLESSYVLQIRLSPYNLELRMDFVLTPEHPKYSSPDAAKQECYKRGHIQIMGFRRVTWEASGYKPSYDATGELDFGNLDLFTYSNGVWEVSGDWGVIRVDGGDLAVSFGD